MWENRRKLIFVALTTVVCVSFAIPKLIALDQLGNDTLAQSLSQQNRTTPEQNETTFIHQPLDLFGHPEDEKCQYRLPKCIIIGIAKCGTNALLTFLSYHPQISARLSPAETKFFSGQYSKGMDWYRRQMNCSFSNQIPIENSPPYFFRPTCAERIHNMDRNIRLLVIVKDPVSRTLSHYNMEQRKAIRENSGAERSLQDALFDPVDGHLRVEDKMVSFSDYASHLEPWLKYFSLKQMHFVDGLRFQDQNPAKELARVEMFLGLRSFFTPKMFVLDEDKGEYCVRLESGLQCLGEGKGHGKTHIDSRVRRKLQQHFRPLNEQFFAMIGRKFSWGYQQVASLRKKKQVLRLQ